MQQFHNVASIFKVPDAPCLTPQLLAGGSRLSQEITFRSGLMAASFCGTSIDTILLFAIHLVSVDLRLGLTVRICGRSHLPSPYSTCPCEGCAGTCCADD